MTRVFFARPQSSQMVRPQENSMARPGIVCMLVLLSIRTFTFVIRFGPNVAIVTCCIGPSYIHPNCSAISLALVISYGQSEFKSCVLIRSTECGHALSLPCKITESPLSCSQRWEDILPSLSLLRVADKLTC